MDLLIKTLFKFLLPIEELFVIAINTGFNIWGFGKKKTYKFNVKKLFLMLESFHDCLSENIELKVLGDQELAIILESVNVS